MISTMETDDISGTVCGYFFGSIYHRQQLDKTTNERSKDFCEVIMSINKLLMNIAGSIRKL